MKIISVTGSNGISSNSMAFYQTVPMISIGFLYLCCQIFFLAWKKRFDVKRVWHATRFVRRNQLCHTQTHFIWWRMAFFCLFAFFPNYTTWSKCTIDIFVHHYQQSMLWLTGPRNWLWLLRAIHFSTIFFPFVSPKKNSISFGSFSFGFRLNCFQQDLKDFNSINMHLT